MLVDGLGASWSTLATVLISTVVAYLALVTYSRLAGLRSFAQMTNFDVAATIALGSMTATTAVTTTTSLLQGVVGIGALFGVQALLATLRRHRAVEKAVDNGPILLMNGSQVLQSNLDAAQMTQDDLRAKLRLAGITRYEQVQAVVMEATGEVSVLTAGPDDAQLDPDLLGTVRGRGQAFADSDAWPA